VNDDDDVLECCCYCCVCMMLMMMLMMLLLYVKQCLDVLNCFSLHFKKCHLHVCVYVCLCCCER